MSPSMLPGAPTTRVRVSFDAPTARFWNREPAQGGDDEHAGGNRQRRRKPVLVGDAADQGRRKRAGDAADVVGEALRRAADRGRKDLRRDRAETAEMPGREERRDRAERE